MLRQAKGGKKASKAVAAEWDWEFQRERIVRPLAAALDANLLVLWRGRAVEESFLTLYTRCARSPSSPLVRIRALRLRAPDAPRARSRAARAPSPAA